MAISDVLLEGGLTFKTYLDKGGRGVKILRFFGGSHLWMVPNTIFILGIIIFWMKSLWPVSVHISGLGQAYNTIYLVIVNQVGRFNSIYEIHRWYYRWVFLEKYAKGDIYLATPLGWPKWNRASFCFSYCLW